MRKYLIVMVAALCLGMSYVPVARADIDSRTVRTQLKAQQKLEWNALKVRQAARKQSWHARRLTSSERDQANHEMARERRDMKQRHRDALQELKDHQRALTAMRRSYGQ